jgi:hypothetical protein
MEKRAPVTHEVGGSIPSNFHQIMGTIVQMEEYHPFKGDG